MIKLTKLAKQVATTLKERLTYAMVKVQHGWQDKNLDEVEVLAAALPPRTNASSPRTAHSSIGKTMVSPRTALTNGTSMLELHDMRPVTYHDPVQSPPSKRRSGAGLVSWAGADSIIPANTQSRQAKRQSHPNYYQPNYFPVEPVRRPANSLLAPAADIRSSNNLLTHRRTPSTSPNPSLLRNSSSQDRVNAHPDPKTPCSRTKQANPRPGLYTSSAATTAQAEKDAMDALMLMGGSPSGNKKPVHFPLAQAPALGASAFSSSDSEDSDHSLGRDARDRVLDEVEASDS